MLLYKTSQARNLTDHTSSKASKIISTIEQPNMIKKSAET
jgi:hypothetical protein